MTWKEQRTSPHQQIQDILPMRLYTLPRDYKVQSDATAVENPGLNAKLR